MTCNKNVLAIASTAFLTTLVACGSEPTEQTSKPSITASIELPEKSLPQVAWITSGGENCSGTFLSDDKMLTAAHCIKGKITYYGKTSVEAVRSISHPKWVDEGGTTVSDKLVPYDLAVVYFPKGTGKEWAFIGPVPQLGNRVNIAGFGSNDWQPSGATSGRGVMRVGDNVILEISGGKITIEGVSTPKGKIETSEASHGDSGGPMFLQYPSNDPWHTLIGVASAGVLSNGKIRNSYVDLNSTASIEFLRSQGIK